MFINYSQRAFFRKNGEGKLTRLKGDIGTRIPCFPRAFPRPNIFSTLSLVRDPLMHTAKLRFVSGVIMCGNSQ